METLTRSTPHQILNNVRVGDDVKLWNFVNAYGCEIGDGSMVGTFCEIQADVKIGQRCRIQSHTFICEHVTIGDDVFVGHGVMFVNDNHPKATAEHKAQWTPEPVVVGDRANIGTGAIILGGVTIGEGAMVGAGAVVREDVPPNTTVVGVPGRVLVSH